MKKEPIVPLQYKLLVGGLAGMLGTSIIFPLDMVKTRLQNQSKSAAAGLRYTGPIGERGVVRGPHTRARGGLHITDASRPAPAPPPRRPLPRSPSPPPLQTASAKSSRPRACAAYTLVSARI